MKQYGIIILSLLLFLSSAAFSKSVEPKPVSLFFELKEHVLAEWGNRWWQAEIIAKRGSRYRVHYVGASKKWDEWLKVNRLAKRCMVK